MLESKKSGVGEKQKTFCLWVGYRYTFRLYHIKSISYRAWTLQWRL